VVRVISLASGSSGNALYVEAGETRVLVDAGLAPHLLRSRLRQIGVAPETLAGILLTHEHHDHACGAVAFACQYGVPLIADPLTLDEVLKAPPALRVAGTPERDPLPVGRKKRLGALEVSSFAVSHDAAAPCGYLFAAGGWQVCVAIDTGEVGKPLARALREARMLVIEANHDEQMLRVGPYPAHLKRRILSTTGHLSNRQTAAALAAALEGPDGGPRWVWLAHLSRTNNRPHLAQQTIADHLAGAGHQGIRLEVMPPDLGPSWQNPTEVPERLRQASLWADAAALPASADALPLAAPHAPAPGERADAPAALSADVAIPGPVARRRALR
jgi:phosphoribosyl 1,2-cyclic phosphodiesterase